MDFEVTRLRTNEGKTEGHLQNVGIRSKQKVRVEQLAFESAEVILSGIVCGSMAIDSILKVRKRHIHMPLLPQKVYTLWVLALSKK